MSCFIELYLDMVCAPPSLLTQHGFRNSISLTEFKIQRCSMIDFLKRTLQGSKIRHKIAPNSLIKQLYTFSRCENFIFHVVQNSKSI